MKKMLNLIIIIIVMVLFVNKVNTIKENNKLQEKKLVNDYVECLNNNHTQRYYCASKVSNISYKTLDQLVEKYGYAYKQVGYDLSIEKVEK